MKGFGTDEDCLITILCTLEEDEIVPLQTAYADRYERSLQQAVESETSGKFNASLILAGCDTIDEAYAPGVPQRHLGLGHRRKSADPSDGHLHPEVMNNTREAYARLYGVDLVDAMSGEWSVSGDFKRLLCALAKKHPDNVAAEPDYAADVATLRDAVEGIGTDEAAIIDVLSCKTAEQIGALKEAYKVEHGEMLKEAHQGGDHRLVRVSANFRATLMGLLTPREEQIAFYLKEAFAYWANDDWAHLDARAPHRGGDEGDLRQYPSCTARASSPTCAKTARATTRRRSWRSSRRARARSREASARRCPAGSRPRTSALIALLTHTETRRDRDAPPAVRKGNRQEPRVGAQGRVQRRV